MACAGIGLDYPSARGDVCGFPKRPRTIVAWEGLRREACAVTPLLIGGRGEARGGRGAWTKKSLGGAGGCGDGAWNFIS